MKHPPHPRPSPTYDEFFGMLPKDRKSYLAKLKGRDREFFMQRLVDTAPKTLNGIRSGLQGIEDALKHSFDILSAAPFRLDDPDEEAQRLIKLHGLLDATRADTTNALFQKFASSLDSNEIERNETINRIDRNAAIAASKNIQKLRAASAGGKKSASTKKETFAPDSVKLAIIRAVRLKIKEWDMLYPERRKQGNKEHSNNQIYRDEARKHLGANGNPIYSETQIKDWFKPSKMRRSKRHS